MILKQLTAMKFKMFCFRVIPVQLYSLCIKIMFQSVFRIVIPSRKTLRSTLLPQYQQKVIDQIKSEVSKCASLYMTVDLWTNRAMKSFFGATLHFIGNDFQPKSRVLACQEFKGRHTSTNIATAYEETVMRYNIQQKVNKVVSDNASSMIKAFRTSLAEVREEQVDNNEDVNLDENLDMDSLLLHLPERVGCFAHTLQLCVMDCLKQTSSEVKDVVKKSSSVVASIRKSSVATEFLRSKGANVETAVVTRWNSQVSVLVCCFFNSKITSLQC